MPHAGSMNWLFWAVLSALFAGITAILAKVGTTGIDSNLATAIRTTVVLVFTWAIAFTGYQTGQISSVPPRGWVFLVLSGMATGASWLCYFRAIQLGPVSRVAPIDKLSIAFVVIFAAMFLGEDLSLMKLGGSLLIVAGAIVLALS